MKMDIDEMLDRMVSNGASDLHLKVGGPPVFRINGGLVPYESIPSVTLEDMRESFEQMTSEAQRAAFSEDLELDFAYSMRSGSRIRVNAFSQWGTLGMVIRLIQTEAPVLDQLGLPEICKTLVMKPRGMVIVTGPTGSGKSTTLAAMINYLNNSKPRKIVTIEDPVEFLHHDNKCVFCQRELGMDTRSFSEGLKHALRQDADVILVGEMRDLDTTAAALTAAETGHLVLATLHTPSAAQAVDRIIDIFPIHQQQQVRTQLAIVLEGVLYQSLIPNCEVGGSCVAVEILICTTAVRNLIREGKTFQIPNVIQTGSQYGMATLDHALIDLCRKGMITQEDAMGRCDNPTEMKLMLGKMPRQAPVR